MTEHVMPTYGRLPVEFARGQGCFLWDTEGKQYLDAVSGIAVCNIGHAHPKVADAICDQARTLMHTSNLYHVTNQTKLADRLCELSGMDQVFFSNSGAEANEAAIKIARLYGHKKGIDNPQIIVMEKSFHGRTLATLSATGNYKIQQGFEPLVTGFLRVTYGDVQAIRNLAAHHKNIVAVLVEPVQGEGGVNIPPASFLTEIRAMCTEHAWLMMVDEVQTGIARTGHWFGHQHNGILPDVMSLAKGLGNGMPIGACLTAGPATGVFQPGNHGSTFGGNPLACRAALAVLETITEEHLCEKATQMGDYIAQGLRTRLADHPNVATIRNLGMMIGLELKSPVADLVKRALIDEHLLINVTAEKVVRLLPPLVMTPTEADMLIERLSRLLN